MRLRLLAFVLAAMLLPASHGISQTAGSMAPPNMCDATLNDPAVRRHIEVLRFDGSQSEGGSFTQTVRNVTRDDAVFLRIYNDNPFRFVSHVKVTTSDAPAQALVHVHGSSLADSASILASETKSAAKDTEDAATSKGADAKGLVKTKTPPTANVERFVAQPNNRRRTPRDAAQALQVDRVKQAEEAARVAVSSADASLDIVDADVRKATGELSRVSRTLAALGDELFRLQETGTRFISAKPKNVKATTSGLGAAVDELMDSYRDVRPALNAVQEVLEARATINNVVDAAAKIAAIESAAETLEEEVGKLDGASDEQLASVLRFRTAASERTDRLKALKSANQALAEGVVLVGKKLSDLLSALGAARRQAETVDSCIRLGSFAENKRVSVEVAMVPRPEKKAAPAEPKKRSAIEEAAAAGDTKAATKEPAAADTPADETTEFNYRIATFDVIEPTHWRTNVGAIVSRLANPTFDFTSTQPPAVDGKPQPKQITVFRKGDDSIQVRPAFQIALYLRPQYFYAVEDDDSYESVETRSRRWPYPIFGVSLTDPTQNYLLGGGFDIARGVSLSTGAHFGRVKRLLSSYAEDNAFPIAADKDFKVDEVLNEGFRIGWYVSLSMDPGALVSLLGGGSNGTKK